MTEQKQSEVTPEELAALVDALGLTPGYHLATGRAYVTMGDELLYANLTGVKLPPHVPGNNALHSVRVAAFYAALEQEERELVAGMTDEQRERHEAEKRRLRDMPDPPDWKVQRELDRQGRVTDTW